MKKLESIVAIIGFLALGLLACGKPPARHSSGISTSDAVPVTDGPGGGDEPPGGEPGGLPPGTGLPMAVSLASFEANLYEPLLKPFCASCHDKTFVDQDPAKAHAAFLLRAGFDKYSGIDQTLPVLKMKQAHNCWDAQTKTCVTMMTEKMKLWMTDLEANGFKPIPLKYPFTSAEVMMSTAAPVAVTAPAEYSGAGVDKATVVAPFAQLDNDIDGPIKFYASAPEATPRLNAVNVAQSVTFNLNGKAGVTYFVWARVKTPADASNEFFIQANAAASVPFIPPVTGKDTWKWAQVMTGVGAAAKPYSFVAAADGAQSMKVQFREGGAKINYLVITSKADFNGELFSNNFYDVPVALNVPGAEGAKIIATVWEKTTDEGKKSLGVKELRIQSPVPLHIKTIYPLVNGIYNNNQGTYTIVDTVAGGPDASKSLITTGGSTASTWLADLKVDKLSFAFELLEIAK